ncbi:tRNA pseudouridine 13 synthase [Fimbriiglobus ruber]|uniref:tRNA pseudouridine synthase D n=2 Tax=Fimbriiglobus ruber TaxID=1908690 RepID=A0A225E3I3_9BACT|nr:tRNA pseudouridine 13 synthase [Fimbriiglobus ruber]
MPHPALDPPLLTPDLPGVGGRIKVRPEDFEVEEVPSYEPSGEGDHLYLWVEKRDVGPEFLARTIAQRLGTHAGAVGTAGLKDRHAVTRQWVSVPKEVEPRLKHVDGDGIRVLKVSRHNNKLKPGHLRGNTFRLLVRGADATKADALATILDRVKTQGMPNYYGPQRFGRDGGTVDLGFKCLAGTQPKRLRPFVYKFALSAVQSLLFNDYLGRRVTDGLFRTVLSGDVMMKWPFGGLFVAEDVPAEQARFDARETVTGGPMFGSRTFATAGPAAEREAVILRDHKLSPAAFAGFGKLMGGTRRHNLVYLDDLTAAWDPDGLRLAFTLPSGCYATILLREVMKANPDDATGAEEEGGEEE